MLELTLDYLPELAITVESCESRHYQTMLNCSLFIHVLAKWLDITSFDAEMIALCLDGKATLISLTIILINTWKLGHTRRLWQDSTVIGQVRNLILK